MPDGGWLAGWYRYRADYTPFTVRPGPAWAAEVLESYWLEKGWWLLAVWLPG
jgi:hypothetical protein